MEERIIEDEGRIIKVKRNRAGGIEDVTEDALAPAAPAAPAGEAAEGERETPAPAAPDGEAGNGEAETPAPAAEPAEDGEEVEIAFDYPDEEYDEDMVGLTPSQLKRAQEERERARKEAEAEAEKLAAEGKKALLSGDYAAAEGFFSQALAYNEEHLGALEGVWESRTQGFEDIAPFFVPENAEKFAGMPEEVRSAILERVGERLKEERAALLEEMRPLKAAVGEAREARRGALSDNKRYYLVRTAIFGGAFVLFLVLTGVFSAFLLRTPDSWPVICMGVSGVLALIAFICLVLFLRGLVFAMRLAADNEKNEGTEDGRRLDVLEEELYCLTEVLGEDTAPAIDGGS